MVEIKEIEFNITISKFYCFNGIEKLGDSISQTSGRIKASSKNMKRVRRIAETLLSKIDQKEGFLFVTGESFISGDELQVEAKKYVIIYDITKYFSDGTHENEKTKETLVDKRGC